MEKAESVDSVVSDCAKTSAVERTKSDDAALPARIVVQNPAGDVTLGEDVSRLKNEVADAQKRHEEHNLEAMQPGGERWAQVAYHQYWLSLCVTLQARKRLMLSPIGAHSVSFVRCPNDELYLHVDSGVQRNIGRTEHNLQGWTWGQCCGLF